MVHIVVRQSVGVVAGNFGLPRLYVPLNLQHVALAKHLRTFDQFVANLCCSAAIDQCVLVLSKLGLESADLQIHFALISRLVHFLCQQLLDRDGASGIVVEAEDCRLFGWQGSSGHWGDVSP